MTARSAPDAEAWLLNLPPTKQQTRWVIAVAACQFAAIAILAPLAGIPLGQMNGFIPAVEGVVFVTDLVTAVLLFSQFASHRLNALLVLASGYLLSALIIIPHALSFPGAFSPIRLPGAGFQTTPWLYFFWHLPFAASLLGYAVMRNRNTEAGRPQGSPFPAISRSIAFVLALVSGLVLVATAGKDYLPALLEDSVHGTPANQLAVHLLPAITTLICVGALVVLWLRRRSVLDQWLMIVALSLVLEIAIVVLLSPRRFDVGFYAGRLFSLLTSTIVLAVLLVATMRLYADLARSNDEARRLSEGRWKRVVDNSVIGIAVADLEGRFEIANAAFQKLIGFTEEELRRMNVLDITEPRFRDRNAALTVELLRGTRDQFNIEKQYRCKDGRVVWARNNVSLLPGADGTPRNMMAIIEDISSRKAAEESLRATQARLARAAELATAAELSASIAHEINQPLSGIITNTNTCLRMLGADPPNVDGARETVRRTLRDGNRASDVVTRLRALFDKKPPLLKAIDLNEAAREVIALLSNGLQANHIVLRADFAGDLPSVKGDRVQLQQVILNLTQNAIESMTGVEDRIRQLQIETKRDEGNLVRLSVKDTGIGLAGDAAEHMFESFYTTKLGGMGIGLAISRSIIEGHEGRLWVEANEGPGLTFAFTIPGSSENLVGATILNAGHPVIAVEKSTHEV